MTNAVVAIWVVFVPTLAVGAVGVPVNDGEARFALLLHPLTLAFCPAILTCPAASPVATDMLWVWSPRLNVTAVPAEADEPTALRLDES